MNYAQALSWAQHQLEDHGIGTARLDALVLLEDNSGVDRAKILAEPKTLLKPSATKQFQEQILARATHLPLSYIRQQSEFYGRIYYIDQRVLEPRPESETLIEELAILLKTTKDIVNIIDVGTGSGALAISAKLNHPKLNVYATDISQDCLNVAKRNAQNHKANIQLIKSDLLELIPTDVYLKPTILLANLPYVPNSWHINEAAMTEPKLAIFGGTDGLRLYARLFDQLSQLAKPPLAVLTESMPQQQTKLANIALSANFNLSKTNDFVSIFNWGQCQA